MTTGGDAAACEVLGTARRRRTLWQVVKGGAAGQCRCLACVRTARAGTTRWMHGCVCNEKRHGIAEAEHVLAGPPRPPRKPAPRAMGARAPGAGATGSPVSCLYATTQQQVP